MPIQTLTDQQWLQNWINDYAASLNILPNLVVGDPALAIAEADAAQAGVLQYLAVLIINFARAQTSTGTDLDSWMAQFGFTRLPSQFAVGQVTFSIPSITTQPIYIGIGTIVQTPGGAIQYTVIPDNSIPTYNSAKQAYYIPVGQTSTLAAVQAAVSGTQNNVQANQLTQMVTTIFGLSAVSNALPIQDGSNGESDVQFRARFVAYINSLSKATETAIFLAIDSIQPGLKIALYENVQAVGNPPTSFNVPYLGNIVALVDDGSGDPPAALISAAYTAVGAVRAFGIMWQVFPPNVIAPTFALNVRIKTGAVAATVESNIQIQIVKYVNALPIGETIYLSDIIEQAFLADSNVIAVEPNSWTIDDVIQDLALNPWEEAIIQLTDVSIGTY